MLQFPPGATPLFLTHGDGGKVYDVDGNEYVDLVNALFAECARLSRSRCRSRHPPPAHARHQLQSADRAGNRTGRAAGEAHSVRRDGALRQERHRCDVGGGAAGARRDAPRPAHAAAAITAGRTGTSARPRAISACRRAVSALSHIVPYGDLAAIDALFRNHPGEFAAVILEPMNATEPPTGYLQGLIELAHRHGALLIFDEIITGFRWSLGGAQARYGVTPDLACFGKAMGNGMPISAVVGRADIMRLMEDIFFSGTFGGEALSLAAAIATIDKMEREDVTGWLWPTGGELMNAARAKIAAAGLAEVVEARRARRHGRS